MLLVGPDDGESPERLTLTQALSSLQPDGSGGAAPYAALIVELSLSPGVYRFDKVAHTLLRFGPQARRPVQSQHTRIPRLPP